MWTLPAIIAPMSYLNLYRMLTFPASMSKETFPKGISKRIPNRGKMSPKTSPNPSQTGPKANKILIPIALRTRPSPARHTGTGFSPFDDDLNQFWWPFWTALDFECGSQKRPFSHKINIKIVKNDDQERFWEITQNSDGPICNAKS